MLVWIGPHERVVQDQRELFEPIAGIEHHAHTLMLDEPIYHQRLGIVMQRIAAHQQPLRRAFTQIATDQYNPSFDHCVNIIRKFIATQAGQSRS